MATERVLSNLNLISFKTEGGLQNHINELQDGDLAFTPDNSLKGILLDFKWADHLLNDMSWLRADTFSWQSGDVYVAAYNHLVEDFENAEVNHWYAWTEIGGGIWYTKTPTVAVGDTVYNDDFSVFGQVDTVYSGTNFTIGANDFNRSASNDITVGDTETIAGIEITYYRAEDGHKICLPDQEDKVLALYNATGVAWYYILDEDNTQFKLPRTKYGFTGLRDEVGGYVEPGLPDHTHTLKGLWRYKGNNNNSLGDGGDNSTVANLQDAIMPASENNPIYGNSDTVQPPATQMYLYFYVGNFERDALEQTAGVTAETLNSKLDIGVGNATDETKATIVGWGIPDYSAGVDITWANETKNITTPSGTVVSSQAYFIAPSDGMVVLHASVSNGTEHVFVNENIVESPSTNVWVNTRFPVSKGDEIRVCLVGRYYNCQFFPFKGVN